jgi:hypothetical protein
MEQLENVAKQTGTAILDFDGKVVKVRSSLTDALPLLLTDHYDTSYLQ